MIVDFHEELKGLPSMASWLPAAAVTGDQ